MDTIKLKELVQKVTNDTATQEEKLEVLHGLNELIGQYNKLLKEALSEPEQL